MSYRNGKPRHGRFRKVVLEGTCIAMAFDGRNSYECS